MPNKNNYILNPYTQTPVFGKFPEIKHRSYTFPEGNIYLKYGIHYRQNNGFGLIHIWESHQHELLPMGYNTMEDSARYVADILSAGAKIHCEFSSMNNERVAIVKSSLGLLIAEHRLDGRNQDYYSVVTAYKNRNVHGVLIGQLK